MASNLLAVILWLALAIPGLSLAAHSDQEAKLEEVTEVLGALLRIPEKSIPPALMTHAQAIAVIPRVVKMGLVVGGRYGKGVVSVRRAAGEWSRPAFLSIAGGSVGWQIGAQSTDLVLVFRSRKGVRGLRDGKFTLGADVGVAAGPVGRHASMATDASLDAEIYSYSRSRGLFAGVSLDGAALQIEPEDNRAYYRQQELDLETIFSDSTRQLPASARRMQALLRKMTEG